MCNENEWIVREAFLAYDRGDVRRMLEFVDPNFEWTHVVPGQDNSPSGPQTDYGRGELEKAVTRQADLGLRAELEEVIAAGEQVMVVFRTPGVDNHLERQADDRTYDVVTVRDGRIVGLRACRDRAEARAVAGIA